jgi:hypothetical protein
MISLSDRQLQTVMTAPAGMTPEKRSMFLERVGAMLVMRGSFTDSDLAEVVKLARVGLAHQPAA